MFQIKDCRNNQIYILGLDAPENTIGAVKQAKANGAKCVHFEVTFTFDGVAVVSAKPEVTTQTLAEARQIDAAEGHVLVRINETEI